MKNLKKLVSVVLSLAMVISAMAVTVSAKSFGDVDTTAGYYEAVNVLSDLAILEGDDQGNFNGDADIKRSEFAAVVCRAMGQENAANGSKGTTIFSDVSAEHWASGYINWAAQQKIVNGKGDGIFDPDAPVKYEEAIKMLVVALGYEPLATQKGGYPTGYFVVAASNGINSGINLSGSDNAPRSVVAQLTYNALDVPLMDAGYITIGGYNEYNIYDGTDNARRTLLSYYLDITKVKAEVLETAISNPELAKKGGDNRVKLELINSYKFDWDDILDGDYDNTSSYNKMTLYAGDTSAEDYLGYTVVAYIGLDENDDYVLKAITPDTKSVDILEVTDNFDVVDYSTGTFEYYENADDLRTQEVDLADEFTVYLNGQVADDEEATFNGIPENASKVVFMGSKSSGDYDKVFVTQYVYDVVNEVNVEDEIVNMSILGDLDLSTERNAKFTYNMTLEDGTPIDLEDLEVNDVLNIICASPDYLDDEDITYMDIVVTRKTVEGNVTEEVDADEGKYVINGEEYKVVPSSKGGPVISVGDAGRYLLTVDNKVIYQDDEWTGEEGSSKNYGFITKIGSTEQFGEHTYQVKMFTTDGSFVTLDIADTLYVYDPDLVVKEEDATSEKPANPKGKSSALKRADGDQDAYFYTKANEQDTKEEGKLVKAIADGANRDKAIEKIPQRFVNYKLNSSNEIRELSIAQNTSATNVFNYDAPSSGAYKEVAERFCGKTFTSRSTLIYAPIPENAVNVDEDDLEVVSLSGLDEDEDYFNSFLFDIDRDNNFRVAVATQGVTASKKSALAVVTQISTMADDIKKVTFFQDGEYKSYPISETCDDLEDLAVGDAFQYTVNGDEIVKGSLVFALKTNKLTSGLDSPTVQYVYGEVEERSTRDITLTNGEMYDFASASDVGTVAVYNTKRTGNNSITKLSSLSSLKNPTREDYMVLLRIEDDMVVDAIEYQYDKNAAPTTTPAPTTPPPPSNTPAPTTTPGAATTPEETTTPGATTTPEA